MPNYVSLAEAKETPGGHKRIVAHLTLTDPQGNRPTNDTASWTDPLVLYLCKGEPFIHNASLFYGWMYEPLIKSFASISEEAEPGDGFGVVSDTQLVLFNKKITLQQDNAEYTFASGSPAMRPAPVGDEVRLAELFQFYNIIGATIVYRILFFSKHKTDQNISTNFKGDDLFTGKIVRPSIGRDEITLDITQDRSALESRLPGRILEAEDRSIYTLRAPIVYGNLHGEYKNVDLPSGMEVWNAVVAGVFFPSVSPGIPIGHKSGQNENFVYCDTKGVNAAWIDQEGWGSGSPAAALDHPFLLDASQGLWSREEGSVPGAGTVEFEPMSTNPTSELEISFEKGYGAYHTYVPVIEVLSSTGLANPANLFDGDVLTHAELDLSTTASECHLKIKPVQGQGEIRHEDDAIRAWILIEGTAVDAATIVHFGLYRSGTGADEYVGTNPGARAPEAVIDQGDMSISTILDQKPLNVDALRIDGDYIRTDGGDDIEEPLLRWDWRQSEGAGADFGSVIVRIACATAGVSGNVLKIIAAGAVVYNNRAKNSLRKSGGFRGDRTIKGSADGGRGTVPF